MEVQHIQFQYGEQVYIVQVNNNHNEKYADFLFVLFVLFNL